VVLKCKVGDTLEKGKEISYFQFDGSDIVLVFQKDANVTHTANRDSLYRAGQQIAIADRAMN
jgi:phosphatidylserine decarboxylase